MHIPDGYLSPSTCAVFYAAAAPFWYTALKRAKRALHTRTVPLLGLFSAFCFVIMMFNLPIPGGTTAHAVGMGMASIVLGPWVSILAICMALLIQALFFGDGGITAFGANCFNMAIVGSLVAYAVYRLVARKAPIVSRRRVVAAAIAGYLGINAAAFCAAVEFGVQPLLFHNAAGAPLYAPYPLSISIPAMMIAHLTFAGFAELVIAAGMVGYLQRANPEMLRFTAPDAPENDTNATPRCGARTPACRVDTRVDACLAECRNRWAGPLARGNRKIAALWAALGVAIILTPLGILAVGTAWGEWRPNDFIRGAPVGLQHLSSLWKAPAAGYAPSFIGNRYLGYLTSAVVGVGLIAILTLFVARRLKRRKGFLVRTTESLLHAAQATLFAEDTARLRGFLQGCDPRVKLAGIGALIISVIAVHRIWALVALFGAAVLLAVLSRISVALLAKRVWIAVLAFTGAIALPAIFLVPGNVISYMPFFDWPVTAQGVTSACFLILRAETAATLALLLVLCTPWNRLLRSLRFFRVPASAVFILEMTYRYIFLLVRTSEDMIESRSTRLVGRLEPGVERRLAAATAGVLLDKSLQLSNDVSVAMQARGFRGEVLLLDDPRMAAADWWRLAGLLVVA
ncbi:MAG: cobalt transporter CbiM, partial [Bryobacteraceae bacterium]